MNKTWMWLPTFVKFGGLVFTLGEDNLISCVAYFDSGKLQ